MGEKENIFRQKAIDKVNSPEQLDSYLKVTSPSVWLILCAIIALLIGAIVWGTVGKLETTIDTGAFVENKIAYCYFKEDNRDKVKPGHIIRIDDKEYVVKKIGYGGQIGVDTATAGSSLDNLMAHLVDVKDKEFVYIAVADCDLEDGAYKATLVLDSVSPLEFVFN